MCMSRDEVCQVVDSLNFAKKVKTTFKEKILPLFNSVESLVNANQKQFSATHRNMCGTETRKMWDAVREIVIMRKLQMKKDEAEAIRRAEAEKVEKAKTMFSLNEIKALAGMMELCNMTEIDIVRIKEFFLCAKVDIGRLENK